MRTFQSFTADIERMADWLISMGITTVAMESTGVYWIPVYEILEESGLAVVLANARDCKTVPGRKSDVNDAQWLQRLHAVACCGPAFARHATSPRSVPTCGFEIGIWSTPQHTSSTCRKR